MKIIKESLFDKTNQIIPGLDNEDITFEIDNDEDDEEDDETSISLVIRTLNTKHIEDIVNILEKDYDNVRVIGKMKPGTNGIVINDSTATIEDVSDLLYNYIAKGIVQTVDYL